METPLLFVNGVIHTMVAGQGPAAALAIDRGTGRVIAVGDKADVRAALGIFAAVDVVDLRGRAVIPGLIDAHTHLLLAAEQSAEVDLSGCHDEAAAAERVAARARLTPPGHWIRGRGWNQNEWPGQRFPSRASLDAAAPDHPVALWTHSLHAQWVNSLALARASFDDATPDPVGGKLDHDADGHLTGLLFEFGATDQMDAAFEAETDDDAEAALALGRLARQFNARGVTAVNTMEGARSLRLTQTLRGAGALPLRVGYYLRVGQLAAARAVGIQAGFGDDFVRVVGIKIFADGALGTRTAAMLQSFDDDPGNLGLLTTTPAGMVDGVGRAARGGLHVAIHAIGDRAVRVALDGIERVRAERPGWLGRCRLEHIQLAQPADIARMARLGVVGSVQPFHAVADRDMADRAWGRRASQSYAYRAMLASGVRLALGSDTPVEMADPWRIMHAAIVRRDDRTPERDPWHAEQALTVAQALYAYTAGAAYASGDEARLGSLAPGLLGDCVILSADPARVPPGTLPSLPLDAVVVGGQVVAGAL